MVIVGAACRLWGGPPPAAVVAEAAEAATAEAATLALDEEVMRVLRLEVS